MSVGLLNGLQNGGERGLSPGLGGGMDAGFGNGLAVSDIIKEVPVFRNIINNPQVLAISLRKLNTSYTGPILTIRRNSDNAELDIYDYNGYINYYEASIFCQGQDIFIKTWYDQSGNGYNPTQPTSSLQPRLTIRNNKVGVLFTGTQYLSIPGTNSRQGGNGAFNFINSPTLKSTIVMLVEPSLLPNQSARYTILDNGGTYTGGDAFTGEFGFCIAYENRSPRVDSFNYATSNRNFSRPANIIFNYFFENTKLNLSVNFSNAKIETGFDYESTVKNYTIRRNNYDGTQVGGTKYDLHIGVPGSLRGEFFYSGYMYEIIIYNSIQQANKNNIIKNIKDFYKIL